MVVQLGGSFIGPRSEIQGEVALESRRCGIVLVICDSLVVAMGPILSGLDCKMLLP